MDDKTKCPFSGGKPAPSNRDWWPGHLDIEALASALQVAKLAFQVCLEPRAVFPLELLELLDVLL